MRPEQLSTKTTLSLRLKSHQNTDKEKPAADFLYNRANFPNLTAGAVVDVCLEKNDKHLVLLVEDAIDEAQKRTVSIASGAFPLLGISASDPCDVTVTPIDASSVILELVDVEIKEQYISRSDMWRVKQFLTATRPLCGVYLHKEFSYCAIKFRVRDMWRSGEKLSSGLVGKDTRIVFRSASACIYLFIQMSQEMWEFDCRGYLYFEKAVKFLEQLFRQWRANKTSHYVTVVLVSRWCYQVDSIESFPRKMRNYVLQDYRGQFYQDFYRLVVQNENYDDWMPVLTTLKPLLNNYPLHMAEHFERLAADLGCAVPTATNSRAVDGNFLETLNMSCNVFVKHHIERVFERTGQVVIFVTPGTGVFSVDRSLSNLTKQRTCDFGVSTDLVILGEQPLHAVPLFIYHRGQDRKVEKEYNLPHWMSYSFYNSVDPQEESFFPQTDIPDDLMETFSALDVEHEAFMDLSGVTELALGADGLPTPESFDQFDTEVFTVYPSQPVSQPVDPVKIPVCASKASAERKVTPRQRYVTINTPLPICSQSATHFVPLEKSHSSVGVPISPPYRELSSSHSGSYQRSATYLYVDDEEQRPLSSAEVLLKDNETESLKSRSWGNSLRSVPSKDDFRDNALLSGIYPATTVAPFNPFKPGECQVKITANRRRWIDVFPTDVEGRAKQTHHYVFGTSTLRLKATKKLSIQAAAVEDNRAPVDDSAVDAAQRRSALWQPSTATSTHRDSLHGAHAAPSSGTPRSQRAVHQVWAWGVTGEEQWNPNIRIGVDWRSITVPALLPLTVDYFPDAPSLRNDKAYQTNEHNIDLDEHWHRRIWSDPNLSSLESIYARKVFDALVSQRLQLAFQIVTLPTEMLHEAMEAVLKYIGHNPDRECFLTNNRVYHRLVLNGERIICYKFTSTRPQSFTNAPYVYQLRIPDEERYRDSKTEFNYDALEQVNWSRVDYLISERGYDEDANASIIDDPNFTMPRLLRSRFMLILNCHPGMRRILENPQTQCDQFADRLECEVGTLQLVDGFVRFMKTMNRVRRASQEPFSIKVSTAAKKQLVELKARGSASSDEVPEIDYASNLSTSNLQAIVATAMDNSKGLTFLVDAGRLPNLTLISSELVHWLMDNVSDVNSVSEGVALGQRLLDTGYLYAISGAAKMFMYGFYLFALKASPGDPPPTVEKPTSPLPVTWLEAGISIDQPKPPPEGCCFSLKTRYADLTDGCSLPLSSTDPRDWILMSHSASYWPGMAFEVTLSWAQATGSVVARFVELLRRASQGCLHMIPVPFDPFAFSYNEKSDPLRSCIQIKLCSNSVAHLDAETIKKFQVSVVKRFGFVSMACDMHRRVKQFIHLSGAMFAVIPVQECVFVWSWNFLLGKRYRKREYTGDTAFEDRMLDDFRTFCSGEDGRLDSALNQFLSTA